MKLPFPELTSPNFPANPFVVSVFSEHVQGDVVAYLHENGTRGNYLAKLQFSLKPAGIVEERIEQRVVQGKAFCPADSFELKEELKRRIKKFAHHYGVVPEGIHYCTLDLHGRELDGQFEPPPAWSDARILKRLRRESENKIRNDKIANSINLCLRGQELLESGRYRAALRQFRDANLIAPDFHLPCIGTAEVLIRENKYDEARRKLQQATSLLDAYGPIFKQRQKEIKRIEDVLGLLRQKQLETQKVLQTSCADTSSSVRGSSFLAPPDPHPVRISFCVEPLPFLLSEKCVRKEFESLDFYHLRLEAERLRFFGGFDDLLAPLHARIDSYEHQIRTVRIVLRRMRGNALLCDEVGLGKTIEAGLVLKEYLLRGMISKILILSAPSLISQWQEEMSDKFGVHFLTNETIIQFPEPRDFWSSPLIIASLALAKREPHQSVILNQDYDLVIVDEAHHLRNRQTLAWKFVNQLKKKHILLLTATPIHNDLEELYNLITLLRPGQLGTPAQFKSDFAERGNPRKPKNMERLRLLLREVMIRNTRASSAVKLPRRIARTISVDFTDSERALYQRISEFVRGLALERRKSSYLLLTILQREAGSSLRAVLPTLEKLKIGLSSHLHSRLEEIVQSIKSVQESSKLSALQKILKHSSDKCLIFTEFLETQAYLAESLAKTGHSIGIFNGSLTSREKANALSEFQGQGRILILTPSGGEGTNLQFCRTLINYDLPWDPMKIEQRIGRIHRIGQTGEVLIYNLAVKGTVEYYLLKILDEKLNLFELVVGETETILGELTEEKDFEEILMGIWLEAANFKDLEVKIEDLGNRILEEKTKYLEAKQFDDAIFKQDYETI